MPRLSQKELLRRRIDDLRAVREALLEKMAVPDTNGQTFVAMARTLIDVDNQLAELDPAFADAPKPPREANPLNDFNDELAKRRAARAVPEVEDSAGAGSVRH